MTYALGAYNWSYDPLVTWSFETTGIATNGETSFSDPVTSPVQQALIEEAFASWQAVSGVTLLQVADNRSYAEAPDIRVGLGSLTGSAGQDGGEIGVTKAYCYVGTSDFAPGITIELQDPSITPLQAEAGGTLLYQDTDSSFEQVALHEIGHALGLEHDSSPTAVMYHIAQGTNRTLSDSDIAGIQAIYGPNQGQDVAQTTLFLAGDRADYTLAQNGSGTLLVQDNVGTEGTTAIATDQLYSFSDGTALADPTGNAAAIARLYHAAFDRDPDLGGLQGATNAVDDGQTLGQISSDFTSSREFANDGWNQLSNMQFIDRAYQNTLDRSPDAAGAQNWLNALDTNTSRATVLVDLAQSQEARALYLPIAGDRSDAEVTRLYQTAFGRVPDPSGLQTWSHLVDGGASDAQVAQGLVGSQEFEQRYGMFGNADFVQALYRNTLHRNADPSGLANWTHQLDIGTSRATVVAGFADSVENRLDTAAATHDGYVFLKG